MGKSNRKKKKLIYKKINNPFFSIITVVKNSQDQITKTIQSIKNQTLKNFEYIVIDGNSTDETIKNILRYRKFINLLISKNDNGVYYAMNTGIEYSIGKVIVFVNSGDLLTKNALKIIYKKFINNDKLDFVFGTVKRHYTKKIIYKYGYNKNRLNYNFDFATSHSTGFFIKKKSLNKIGKYNTKFRISADYDLYYRAILTHKLKGDFTKKEQLIGIFNKGGFSSQITFWDHLIEETKIRIHNKQNFLLVGIIFLNAIIKFFIKNII